MKKRFMIIFISFIIVFFFYSAYSIEGKETLIIDKPNASEIVYGEPLFEARLIDGKANVDGSFLWKNEFLILDAGKYEESVVFIPDNDEYEIVEFNLDIIVNKRRVYLSFEDEIYKHYDGTTFIDLPNYVVGGIVDDSVYVKGKLVGEFEDALIGESKISLSGIELAGDKVNNYYLDIDNFFGTIYRTQVEKFGTIKHRVEFKGNTYVPSDTLIYVDKLNDIELKKKGYDIKEVYDVYLAQNSIRIDVDDRVEVRLKIDESSINFKRINLFNYYNGKYEKLEYKYENGYLVYKANSLGNLVITQRQINFLYVYLFLITLFIVLAIIMLVRKLKGREKINKYKSMKRCKDNEYN